MTVVDYIDLDNDERYVEVDFADLSTDEDSVEKINVPEDDSVARSENVANAAVSSSISEQDATPTTSFSKLEQERAATASLLIVEHGAATSSLVAEEARQPEHEAGAVVFSSMTAQGAATSLLLTKQGGTTSSLREDKATLSGNQVFFAAVDCAKEATQSENTAKAAGVSSITEGGAVGLKGDTGNAMGSTGTYNLHAEEEPKGDNEKYENCNYEAEPEAHCQEVSQDVLAMSSLPPQDKEKEVSLCGNFYGRKGKKQANTSATECKRQLSIVHSKGVPPTLHNGDSRFSVMGNVRNGTDSTGINVLDAEVPMWTYQGCSKTSQGNTMYGKVRESGSNGCIIGDYTNGADGGTPLCISHNSSPRKRCAVIGCTKAARSEGRTDHCVKQGGGKRCKYDGCGKGARGKTDYCIAHGGGRRCMFQGCMKSAQGRTDYCMKHGGGRRCKFLGCSVSAACWTDFCSMHRTISLNGNSAHEMLPALAPACRTKMAESSKRGNSHSVIGGRSQKRHKTNDYVNTRSFNVVEAGEEKGRVFYLSEQYAESTADNSQDELREWPRSRVRSPPRKFRSWRRSTPDHRLLIL